MDNENERMPPNSHEYHHTLVSEYITYKIESRISYGQTPKSTFIRRLLNRERYFSLRFIELRAYRLFVYYSFNNRHDYSSDRNTNIFKINIFIRK